MNLKTYINNSRSLIDKNLSKHLPSEKEEPIIIHKAMRYSVFSGGKRLRPILAVESCRICGPRRLKDAIVVGCAVELIHAYSLIHDDLPAMDDDDYRRGKPSCHIAFGEANAILAGGALLTLAFNIISKNLNAKTGMAAIRELSEAIGTKGMVGGQVIDLKFQNKVKGKKKLIYINRLKTAKLFEASVKCGAIAAGAGKSKISAMAEYGDSLGLAFQIVDDILDSGDYVKVFGITKAAHDARSLIDKAKGALTIFGRKAERLKEIADYVLARIDDRRDK